MNLKENDNLPNSEVFVLEEGEPVKKNIEDLIKNKKVVIFGLPELIPRYVLQSIYLAM